MRVGLYRWRRGGGGRTLWHAYEGVEPGRTTFACGLSATSEALRGQDTRIVEWLDAPLDGVCRGCVIQVSLALVRESAGMIHVGLVVREGT